VTSVILTENEMITTSPCGENGSKSFKNSILKKRRKKSADNER
jgi:hypothetical protein